MQNRDYVEGICDFPDLCVFVHICNGYGYDNLVMVMMMMMVTMIQTVNIVKQWGKADNQPS